MEKYIYFLLYFKKKSHQNNDFYSFREIFQELFPNQYINLQNWSQKIIIKTIRNFKTKFTIN